MYQMHSLELDKPEQNLYPLLTHQYHLNQLSSREELYLAFPFEQFPLFEKLHKVFLLPDINKKYIYIKIKIVLG